MKGLRDVIYIRSFAFYVGLPTIFNLRTIRTILVKRAYRKE